MIYKYTTCEWCGLESILGFQVNEHGVMIPTCKSCHERYCRELKYVRFVRFDDGVDAYTVQEVHRS